MTRKWLHIWCLVAGLLAVLVHGGLPHCHHQEGKRCEVSMHAMQSAAEADPISHSDHNGLCSHDSDGLHFHGCGHVGLFTFAKKIVAAQPAMLLLAVAPDVVAAVAPPDRAVHLFRPRHLRVKLPCAQGRAPGLRAPPAVD